nr:transposase [Parasutterella excrementihominis]
MTVSSYLRYIKEARQGFNKVGGGLDSVRYPTLFDLHTHQPIDFAGEPGNLADVAGITNAIKQLSFLNISKAQIVTDKGYYSQDIISQLLRKHFKFLTAVSNGLSWVNRSLQENKPSWRRFPAFALGTSISTELPSRLMLRFHT